MRALVPLFLVVVVIPGFEARADGPAPGTLRQQSERSSTLKISTTLILHNGVRYEVEGPIREEKGRVIFRTGGALYSIPLADVDLDATRASVSKPVFVSNDDRKLKVSPEERNRLLRELEQNHTGRRATESGTPDKPADRQVEKIDGPADRRESQDASDEWSWRLAARKHEEDIRRAKEDLALLHDRADALKHQIEQFFALGYRPNQFTYQSSELQVTLEQIPAAELAITRAQRAYDQFREDARRQGIMPGWLR